MRKIKAFTLIEVMISIFIFTTAMLGYMSFHAHSMSVVFDNESAQFAHSLAFDLIEEINSMSYKDFSTLVDATLNKANPVDDKIIQDILHLPDAQIRKNPHHLVEGDDYKFNRFIATQKYTDKTGVFAQTGSFVSTLYNVEVSVYWPKRGKGDKDCTSNSNFETDCNQILIPLVRSNRQTFGKK